MLDVAKREEITVKLQEAMVNILDKRGGSLSTAELLDAVEEMYPFILRVDLSFALVREIGSQLEMDGGKVKLSSVV
jgi:hypothetical protein